MSQLFINMNDKKNGFSLISVAIVVLCVLLLLSMGYLVVRLAVSLPHTDDTFVIKDEFDTVEVADDKVIWSEDSEITIFRTSEVDENGNVVVESNSGDKIIAPGMEGNYRFEIKNLGKFAVDTTTIVSTKLTVNDKVFDDVPIEVRFTNYKGESVTEGGWINVNNLTEFYDELTIAKRSYVYFNLDWRWVYEGGNDELDTILGDLSASNDVKFTVSIVASATRCGDKDASGGIPIGEVSLENGLLNIAPFIAFNVIIVLIIVALSIREYYNRKKESSKYRIAQNKNK